ncbi:MAG: META domain-containing protein [Fimbriimonadaceae bacterium]
MLAFLGAFVCAFGAGCSALADAPEPKHTVLLPAEPGVPFALGLADGPTLMSLGAAGARRPDAAGTVRLGVIERKLDVRPADRTSGAYAGYAVSGLPGNWELYIAADERLQPRLVKFVEGRPTTSLLFETARTEEPREAMYLFAAETLPFAKPIAGWRWLRIEGQIAGPATVLVSEGAPNLRPDGSRADTPRIARRIESRLAPVPLTMDSPDGYTLFELPEVGTRLQLAFAKWRHGPVRLIERNASGDIVRVETLDLTMTAPNPAMATVVSTLRDQLVGKSWDWVETRRVGQVTPRPPAEKPMLRFLDDGTFRLHIGRNSFPGRFEVARNTIRFTPSDRTRPSSQADPLGIFGDLSRVRTFEVGDDRLVLRFEGDQGQITLIRRSG